MLKIKKVQELKKSGDLSETAELLLEEVAGDLLGEEKPEEIAKMVGDSCYEYFLDNTEKALAYLEERLISDFGEIVKLEITKTTSIAEYYLLSEIENFMPDIIENY